MASASRSPASARVASSPLLLVLFLFSSILQTAVAQTTKWSLKDDYFATSPTSFFSKFAFFTDADPTNGAITYVGQTQAEAEGLIGFLPSSGTHGYSVFMGVDRKSTGVAKRDSVRISSTASYSAPLLLVADIQHMPTGCGTWPSWWMLGAGTWPAGGEIDIIEGVNAFSAADSQNQMTLHTGPNCKIASNASHTAYSGTLLTADCDVNDPSQSTNAGCGIQAPQGPATFGPAFNAAGGGTYAASWTADDGVSVWFFGPGASPASLKTNNPDTSTFGTPLAQFSGNGCQWAESFVNMQMIFNTALCGAWAGQDSVWQSSGCAASTGKSSCAAYISSPEGMQEAYWLIQGLRTFTPAA